MSGREGIMFWTEKKLASFKINRLLNEKKGGKKKPLKAPKKEKAELDDVCLITLIKF